MSTPAAVSDVVWLVLAAVVVWLVSAFPRVYEPLRATLLLILLLLVVRNVDRLGPIAEQLAGSLGGRALPPAPRPLVGPL